MRFGLKSLSARRLLPIFANLPSRLVFIFTCAHIHHHLSPPIKGGRCMVGYMGAGKYKNFLGRRRRLENRLNRFAATNPRICCLICSRIPPAAAHAPSPPRLITRNPPQWDMGSGTCPVALRRDICQSQVPAAYVGRMLPHIAAAVLGGTGGPAIGSAATPHSGKRAAGPGACTLVPPHTPHRRRG